MLLFILFWLFLSIAAFIDAKWGIVPDRLNLLASILLPVMAYVSDPHGWIFRLIIAILLLISLQAAAWLSEKITGRQEVGGGDIKLIFWFGLGMGFLAMKALIYTLLLFFIVKVGLVAAGRGTKEGTLPLIPFLWLGSVAVYLF
jgi:leader peptidase (prepilin peptidase) / N-methyltransferase